MNSLTLKFACGYTGVATGTAAAPTLKATVNGVARVSFSGASNMVYVGTTTLTASSSGTLDLTSGLTSPLNESITGSIDFAKIYGVFIEHDSDSVAVSGIHAFGAGDNDFQGPYAALEIGKPALLPGAWMAFGWDASKAGWTVNSTHKNIALTNLDSSFSATVNVFLLGTV